MTKQCIYCPREYTVADGDQAQSRYGTCPQCQGVAEAARAEGEGLAAVVELASLAGENPRGVLARIASRQERAA